MAALPPTIALNLPPAGILSIISPCASKSWPTPTFVRSECAASGGGDAAGFWRYPVTCAADNPNGAAEIMECLLFQKWRWQSLLNDLRVLLSQRPPVVTRAEARPTLELIAAAPKTDGGAVPVPPAAVAEYVRLKAKGSACVAWCTAMHDLLERLFDTTNITTLFLEGGMTYAGPNTTKWLPTLDDAIFPQLNSYVIGLASGSGTTPPPLAISNLPAIIPMMSGRDVANIVEVDGWTPAGTARWSMTFPGLVGTGWPTVLGPLVNRAMPAQSTGGMSAGRNPAFAQEVLKRKELYTIACGDNIAYAGSVTKGGQATVVRFPSMTTIMEFWAKLANDVLTKPYESFVTQGVAAWTETMSSWAAAGYINKTPAQIGELARAAATTGSRVAVATGMGIAAGVATIANPIAGLVVGAVGAVTDLLFALGLGAVGGWHCPPQLLRRQAGGACDFSRILGDASNIASQAGFILDHVSDSAQAAANAAQQPSATQPNVLNIAIAGALGLGVGVGLIYLIKR